MPAPYKKWFGRCIFGFGAFVVALWVASGTASAAPTFTFTGNTNFTANNAPRPFTLTWTYQSGATCVASGAWSGTKSTTSTVSGSTSVSTPGVYRLTCSNSTGSAYKDIVVSCAITSQGGLNIYGNVCTQCPALPTDPQPVTTGSNASQATCRFTVNNTQYYICNSGTATGVGSPYCGFGKLSTPLPAPTPTPTPTAPTCTSFTYSDWSACVNGIQTRTVVSNGPSGCTGGSPVLTQNCTVACAAPTLKNPPVVACNANGTADITWDWTPGVTGANGYQIDVAKNSSFSPLLVAGQNTALSTTYSLTDQAAGTYYARVRTIGGTAAPACSGTSAWSSVASATPNCPLPPILAVSLKANRGDSTSCSPNTKFTLSWTATPGATCSATTGNWSPSNGNPQTITFAGTAPVTYGIRCTLNGQTVTDSVTVSPR